MMESINEPRLTDRWPTCVIHERDMWINSLGETVLASDTPRVRLLYIGYMASIS